MRYLLIGLVVASSLSAVRAQAPPAPAAIDWQALRPEILRHYRSLLQLDTSVEGVAAVIGVYTAVLVVGLPLSAALHNRVTGSAGALLFAAASIGCASSNSLELLLVMRALQALTSIMQVLAFSVLLCGSSGRR